MIDLLPANPWAGWPGALKGAPAAVHPACPPGSWREPRRASLSSRRAKERLSNSALFNAFRTLPSLLQHQSEAHPLSFQSLPNSFVKTPGWHHRVSGFVLANPELSKGHSPKSSSFTSTVSCELSTVGSVSPLESALTKKSAGTGLRSHYGTRAPQLRAFRFLSTFNCRLSTLRPSSPYFRCPRGQLSLRARLSSAEARYISALSYHRLCGRAPKHSSAGAGQS
jgi:hypothetical protein